MKKKIFAILLAGTLVLSSSPPVFADEKDDKIEQLEAQISEMQKTIDELQNNLTRLHPEPNLLPKIHIKLENHM